MTKLVLRKISQNEIHTVEFPKDIFKEKTDDKYWLQIKTTKKNELNALFNELQLSQKAIDNIVEPQQSTHARSISSCLIFNLKVSQKIDPYRYDFMTFLLKENFLITICTPDNEVFEEIEIESWTTEKSLKASLGHVLNLMINEIIQDDITNLAQAREIVRSISKEIDFNSPEINMNTIISTKQNISRLHNIIEDQFNMINVIPLIEWSDFNKTFYKEFLDTIKGFDHLLSAAERLDRKLNVIQSQHQLILQEKGNRRLNTLTIIQSIFTPLTFITGIYGMNFLNMPELKMNSGYFVALGFMLLITLGQIWWFKSNGWFD
ncbi:magnesium transporter CorA family protein [Sediminitomix flava]|uniref:Magnesium/cobalt transport protein CorA n=1 Tax=Sediminitomix flava TaxID=379075 RepID=A0A315Z8B6_SEDFL|nr:CorA family divalent cation transporter [Sediminitomix flava]PWJ40165.1 magnesium/cobalt transport protein CorA [Sediminitomix flava]